MRRSWKAYLLGCVALVGLAACSTAASSSPITRPGSLSDSTDDRSSATVGSSSGASPTSPAAPPAAGRAAAAVCDGDAAAARTVAVYQAMLSTTDGGNAMSAPHLYVSRRWSNGSPGDSGQPAGLMSAAVQACLTTGVRDMPPVSIVGAWDDPAIPKVGDQPIPGIAGGGIFVTFGDVPATGETVTSSVTLNRGAGAVAGARYEISIANGRTPLVRALEQWIS